MLMSAACFLSAGFVMVNLIASESEDKIATVLKTDAYVMEK